MTATLPFWSSNPNPECTPLVREITCLGAAPRPPSSAELATIMSFTDLGIVNITLIQALKEKPQENSLGVSKSSLQTTKILFGKAAIPPPVRFRTRSVSQ